MSRASGRRTPCSERWTPHRSAGPFGPVASPPPGRLRCVGNARNSPSPDCVGTCVPRSEKDQKGRARGAEDRGWSRQQRLRGLVRRQRHHRSRRPRTGPARPGCTSGRPGRRGCTTWSGRSSTTPSTRPWPGYCTQIDVTLLADGGCRVKDNGRGIPVEPNEPSTPSISAAELVLTTLHAGGKFGGVGLQGVGWPARRGGLGGERPVVASSCSRSTATASTTWPSSPTAGRSRRSSRPPARLPRPRRRGRTGTTVTFWPDASDLRGDRVPGPDHPRAPADDGLPQQGPRDPLRRRARRARAEDHVPLLGRHRRLREAPQHLQGGAVPEGVLLRPVRGRPGGGDRAAVEHGVPRVHPLLRQRHLDHRGRHARGGLQEGPHQRGEPLRPGQGRS